MAEQNLISDTITQKCSLLIYSTLSNIEILCQGLVRGQGFGEEAGEVAALGCPVLCRRLVVFEHPGARAGKGAHLMDQESDDIVEYPEQGAGSSDRAVTKLDSVVAWRNCEEIGVLCVLYGDEKVLELGKLSGGNATIAEQLRGCLILAIDYLSIERLRDREHGAQ